MANGATARDAPSCEPVLQAPCARAETRSSRLADSADVWMCISRREETSKERGESGSRELVLMIRRLEKHTNHDRACSF